MRNSIRRLVTVVSVAVAAAASSCAPERPPAPNVFAPITSSYLPKLRLSVASVDLPNVWVPPQDGLQHAESLAPTTPATLLEEMARSRLIPGASDGRARFVIDDASIVETPSGYIGRLAIHLDLRSGDGQRTGYAEAKIQRTQSPVEEDPAYARAAVYDLTKAMIRDMNVEFEYQIRRNLKAWLQATSGSAPPPAAVEAAPLAAPSDGSNATGAGQVTPLPP